MSRKRLLETVSVSALHRLSPAENVKAGYSAKAERYARKGVRLGKNTATISKRQFLKKQTAEREGLAKPVSLERASKARSAGEFRYANAATEAQAGKQRETAAVKKSFRFLPDVKSVSDLAGKHYRVKNAEQRFLDFVARKDAGETVPIHEFKAMMDVGSEIKYPRLAELRRSPITRPTS
jgi:hypothetical protein